MTLNCQYIDDRMCTEFCVLDSAEMIIRSMTPYSLHVLSVSMHVFLRLPMQGLPIVNDS